MPQYNVNFMYLTFQQHRKLNNWVTKYVNNYYLLFTHIKIKYFPIFKQIYFVNNNAKKITATYVNVKFNSKWI